MGNDGGSIPDRRDLVRTKAKAEQADKANQTRARWFYCALSKRPLQEPIVSCALGKLYNKDAILEYLLDKNAYGDGDEICGHIKSLKDIKELKLTPNPSPKPSGNADVTSSRAQFVCPITLKEMNGGVPFVYLAPCGCVVSRAGLKALVGTGSVTPPSDSDKSKSAEEGKQVKLEICPQCGTKYEKDSDVRTLNPDEETEYAMRMVMEARQRAAKAAKASKSKKRKNNGATAEDGSRTPAADAESKGLDSGSSAATGKAPKKARTDGPSLNPSVSAMSSAVMDALAGEEAKRKAGMSDAVRSLYEGKANASKETFMTRTFNRYA